MAFNNNPFEYLDKSLTVPCDPLLERTVLGLMLTSGECVEIGIQHLEEEFFPNVDNSNRAIFHAIKILHSETKNIDVLTVNSKLAELKLLSSIGGIEYLAAIAQDAITYSAMKDYCLKLKDLNLLRNTLKVMDNFMDKYRKSNQGDVNDYISDLARDITKVAEERRIMDFESTKTIARDLQAYLDTMKFSGTGKLIGSSTGFVALDEYTHGFQADNYVIVAARPSVGKTAFALSLAYNLAVKNSKTVGFFSLEMSSRLLMMRLLAKVSGVPSKKISEGNLSQNERLRIAETLKNIEKANLFIDETPNININDLVIKARKLKREHDDLTAIVIDYIGLVSTTGKQESRQLELSEISKTLKALARELKITVVALSQLSREVEKRPGMRPQMSDLRESGSLEQDADQVILMYREDYYVNSGGIKLANAQYAAYYNTMKEGDNELSPSPVDLMLVKNRNGQTGNIILMFFKGIASFDNPDISTLSMLKSMSKSSE